MKQINVMVFQLKLLCFMTIHLVFHVYMLEPYRTSTIPRRIHDPPPLLKSMVNKNMKWNTFWIHGSLVVNSSSLFIGMNVMWASAFGNYSRTYQMLWRGCMNFIDDIQTNPRLLLLKLITKKGGDAMGFILLNVHPWLILNSYLIFNLASIHS